jgi:hypothetical protein
MLIIRRNRKRDKAAGMATVDPADEGVLGDLSPNYRYIL